MSGVSANEYAVHRSPNKRWRSNSITNALIAIFEMSLKILQITCKSPDFLSPCHQKSFTRGIFNCLRIRATSLVSISPIFYVLEIDTQVLEETLYGNIHTPTRYVCVEKLRSSIGASCPTHPSQRGLNTMRPTIVFSLGPKKPLPSYDQASLHWRYKCLF